MKRLTGILSALKPKEVTKTKSKPTKKGGKK